MLVKFNGSLPYHASLGRDTFQRYLSIFGKLSGWSSGFNITTFADPVNVNVASCCKPAHITLMEESLTLNVAIKRPCRSVYFLGGMASKVTYDAFGRCVAEDFVNLKHYAGRQLRRLSLVMVSDGTSPQ